MTDRSPEIDDIANPSVMLQGGFDLIHEDKNVLSSNYVVGQNEESEDETE